MSKSRDLRIAQLLNDSANTTFTAFVENARLLDPPQLAGEVWQHARATAEGEFADGHRIVTSRIVKIHTAGESVWVATETGSTYGVLSFTPRGWEHLNRLQKTLTQTDNPTQEKRLSPNGQSTYKLPPMKPRRPQKPSPKEIDPITGEQGPFGPKFDPGYTERLAKEVREAYAQLMYVNSLYKHDS